jgi:predicted dehydrogenase
MNRRTFILAAGAGIAASRAAGANDRVNVAVIGLRGRGREHVGIFGSQPDSTVAAVVDIDDSMSERAVAQAEKVQNSKPKSYRDLRRMLEDKNIDAVSIATCNHWHALATIWAVQAGKDVYCEKPASHNIFEGRKMVEAARKYNRMVQVGCQSRSMIHKRRGIELLQQGAIGKVYMAKGLCYKLRPSIGKSPNGPVPPGIDYDTWLGPAPMRPFNPNRFHYNWHWFWDTGNGDIGNQGIHEMDLARWGLGVKLPKGVSSTGGKFVYDDDQETPNTQIATFDYGDKQLVFEVRGLPTGNEAGMPPVQGPTNNIGVIYWGSEGYMTLDDMAIRVYKGEKLEMAESMKFQESKTSDTAPHMKNFLAAVKSRKYTDLHADIEEGHVSAALVHLANASYRVGRTLHFDPTTEKFVNDAEANKLITREYRKPFVVPERV